MLNLYVSLTIMLCIALGLIVLPDHRSIRLWLAAALFTALACGLYVSMSHQNDLKGWLAGGAEHYKLQEQFSALGGLQGAIQKIQSSLLLNPNNVEGWLLLSKLYSVQHDEVRAKKAAEHAALLQKK